MVHVSCLLRWIRGLGDGDDNIEEVDDDDIDNN